MKSSTAPRTGRASLLAVALAGLTLLALPTAAHATFPGATGLLAFQSDRDGDYGIWLGNADGSGARVLYDRKGTDEFNPAWSPSGTSLVVQTGPTDGSDFDLVLVDGDGRVVELLTGPASDRAAQFCDQDTIVLTRELPDGSADVYSVRTDGSRLRRLTTDPARDSFPTCHPDGTRIAFISDRDGAPAIWEMRRDGSSPRRLVEGFAVDPDYAPDGSAIAYSGTDPVDGSLEIFVKDLATGQTTQRTHTGPTVQNRFPRFAPAYGRGVIPAVRAPLEADSPIWLFFTQIRTGLAFPEVNVAITGAPTGTPTALCGDPPAGPPAGAANPDDPGGPKNNAAPAPQPAVDCRLEPRDGTLYVTGTTGDDHIAVLRDGEEVVVKVQDSRDRRLAAGARFPRNDVKRIDVMTGDGSDSYRNSTGIPDRVDLGKGLNVGKDGVLEVPDGKRIGVHIQGVITTGGVFLPRSGLAVTIDGEFVGSFPTDAVKKVLIDHRGGPPTGSVRVVRDGLSATEVAIRGPGYVVEDSVLRFLGTTSPAPVTTTTDGAVTIGGVTYEPGTVTRIDLTTGSKSDRVTVDEKPRRDGQAAAIGAARPIPVRIASGAGDDVVVCRGAAVRCTVKAGPGADLVRTRDGVRGGVDGGPGRDTVIADRVDRVRNAELVTRS